MPSTTRSSGCWGKKSRVPDVENPVRPVGTGASSPRFERSFRPIHDGHYAAPLSVVVRKVMERLGRPATVAEIHAAAPPQQSSGRLTESEILGVLARRDRLFRRVAGPEGLWELVP
jgi:hypothetical protein